MNFAITNNKRGTKATATTIIAIRIPYDCLLAN